MGTGVDTTMDRKIPTMLWKTQLLKLVSEVPKAVCVECSELGYQRFPSSSSTSGSEDSHSDQSIGFGCGSGGSDSHFAVPFNNGGNEKHLNLNGNTNHQRRKIHIDEIDGDGDDELARVVSSLAELEMEMQCMSLNLQNSLKNAGNSNSHSPSPQSDISKDTIDKGNKGLVVMRRNNLKGDSVNSDCVSVSASHLDEPPSVLSSVVNLSVSEGLNVIGGVNGGTTAAAPWHRPSIYLFNPFGKSFHGYISHSETQQLLTKDGMFLVRKRIKDNEDDFVLSFRLNGQTKNFLITFDDTSGLIYVGDREKGYESLEELVQEGLITMYLDHKAGPYIDLMCDLTRFNAHQSNASYNQRHLAVRNNTAHAPLIHFNGSSTDNGSGNGSAQHLFTLSPSSRAWSSSKQNSPSPSVSSLSRSSMERGGRNADLKSHSFEVHTFQDLFKCHICQNFLWGLSSQGLLCQDCGFIIHESCVERVSTECEPRLSQLPSIFGAQLTVLVKANGGQRPPFLLEKCITEIEARGLHIEGIYRVSGSRELTERLKNLFEREREGADVSKHADIHSMCGLVKFFLRQLPQPLITKEVFHRFITNSNGGLSLEIVRRDLKKLPPANYITLKYLLQHLHRVAEGSDRNKMNPFNLSSVFAPSLLCPSQITMETLKTGTAAIELMITQVRNLYPKS